MKKKAALKILAVLLTFVMAAGNVFAAAGTATGTNTSVSERAADTSTSTAPTVKWTLNNVSKEYDETTGISVTTEGTESASIDITYKTEAVTGGSASVSGYTAVNAGDYSILKQNNTTLPSIFSSVTVSGKTVTVTFAPQTEAVAENTYTIPAGILKFWNGTAYEDSEAVSVKITVTAKEEEPPVPDDSSSETESSSEEESKPGTTDPSGPEDPSESEKPSETETVPNVSDPEEVADALDKALEEIGEVTGADDSVAEKIDAVAEALVKDIAKDGLAKALEEDSKAAENYASLDDKALVAKGIKDKVDNKVDENVQDLVKGDIQVVGLGLNADKDTQSVGLAVSKPEKNETVSSSYNKSVQLDIKLTVNGEEKELAYPITITMPIPGTLSATRLEILHYHDGKSSSVNFKVNAEKTTVTFTVTDFSTFVFANRKASSSGGSHRPSGSGSSSSTTVVNRTNTATLNVGKWVQSSAGWWYSFGNNTYPKSQWLKLNNLWYFFDGNGYMAEGWKQIDGKWYYLNPSDGNMAEGWKAINGKWYYLNPSDGNMAEGWKSINGKWYYLNPGSGDMATGWKQINGKWYYLDAVNGNCFINTVTPDGRHVDSTGALIK